jgi:SAM-dependent methyltransferase
MLPSAGVKAAAKNPAAMSAQRDPSDAYSHRLDQERQYFDALVEFDDLPPIYGYWSHTFVRPMLEPIGGPHPRDVFARYLFEGAQRCADGTPTFLSIGSGDANNEVEVARMLAQAGCSEFAIECLEMSPVLIDRAAGAVREAGLEGRITFTAQDVNTWQPSRGYHGIMANQSLHHVMNLEGLFDAIRGALLPGAYFAISDMIGRNGHQRWPEARHLVERFWSELPFAYRYHRKLRRHEERFTDWDCSGEGFEGIRAQDILPLLLERFAFHAFAGFGNVIDPFVDRGFGPNFDANGQWDRAFIDRVHACDERALAEGLLTPTHMVAVISMQPSEAPYFARGLSPQASVRRPSAVVTLDEMNRADVLLQEYFQPPPRWLPLRGLARQVGEIHGWGPDDWSGESLEFSVVPLREITRARISLTMPAGIPAGVVLSAQIGESRSQVAATLPFTVLDCSLRLQQDEAVPVRIATSATVNHKQLGISEDQRDLGFHLDSMTFE